MAFTHTLTIISNVPCSIHVTRHAQSTINRAIVVRVLTTVPMCVSRVYTARMRRGSALTHIASVSTCVTKPDQNTYDILAFDDQTSTFIIPEGGGFEVVFCPPGRSSNILATLSAQLHQLASSGRVTPSLLADTSNITLIRSNSAGLGLSAGDGVYWALAATVLVNIWYTGLA